jgi:AmmeMemoRadiSam system protein B/AmmeMemoRadiSam system protein A
MNGHLRYFGSFLVALGLAACGPGCGGSPANSPTADPEAVVGQGPTAPDRGPVRLPAVAGLFYPKPPGELSDAIAGLLAAAPAPAVTNLKALICPHAGYVYSGPVAARAYKALSGRDYRTVIILAASHYADFRGVSVPAAAAYETPLGRVPVSERARQLARQPPFILEPRCFVQRPAWSEQASKPAPPAGDDTPETWEHAVEVQVPFLQKTLKNFAILPVVFGNADPAEVARGLAAILDDQTLVIASTDLSHYHPYDEAQAQDRQTVKWICAMDFAALQAPEAAECACGRMAVLTLMHLARLKGWTPQGLDQRNSGDTAGDKSRVVGYSAIAFCAPAGAATASPAARDDAPPQFNAAERRYLLGLARQTLSRVTAGGGLPEVKAGEVPARCQENKGCFVTLTRNGQLRGCIGNILPVGPLYQAVLQNVQSAALHDSRFSPVKPEEVSQLHIEVSVLTEPKPLAFGSPEELLRKLRPNRDGVVLKIGGRGATFLPQVWEQLPDKAEFLSRLAEKAGAAASAWRGKDVTVSTYQVEAFAEPKK